jgi:uncharacterized lipoprotein YddW (UPF0748 family)
MKRCVRIRFVSLATGILVLAGGLGLLAGCRGGGGAPGGRLRPGRTAAGRTPPKPMPPAVRAVWVARMHYRYADDVRTIIRNCAELGCNTVLWQVRGEGTAAYASTLEPWAREFDFRAPGFDPLAVAVAEAHRRGLRIEAWLNVLPGWKGSTPPPVRGQLWNAHPDWFLRDAAGQRQPLGDFYVILNPCLPEVRRHLAAVAAEIAGRYDVDGLHLDYVRYAWDGAPAAAQRYPRDRRTLALYRGETGRRPEDDPQAWTNWRANQLTRLVADIRAAVRAQRPGATLTAAVVRNPQAAAEQYFQDADLWLRSGLVDALYPMAYTDKLADFEADIGAYRQALDTPRQGPAAGGRIIPGLGIYKHATAAVLRAQLARCQDWGGDFAVFSYESLFPSHQDRQTGPSAAEQEKRRLRRGVLREFARG